MRRLLAFLCPAPQPAHQQGPWDICVTRGHAPGIPIPSLTDTCHLSHSHQPSPGVPSGKSSQEGLNIPPPTCSPGLPLASPLIPLSSSRLVALSTCRGNNGVLKPAMQMASFVLPGVTESPGRGVGVVCSPPTPCSPPP